MTLHIKPFLSAKEDYAEQIYDLLREYDSTTIDMQQIDFIRPYGVIVLISIIRYMAEKTQRTIEIENLQEKTIQYLERIDFFDFCRPWLANIPKVHNPWSRNPETARVLELTRIQNADDVYSIIQRAETILGMWLPASSSNKVLQVLSELCSNIHQHSQDPYGCAVIQTHQYHDNSVCVRIAVGDMGIGIKTSLQSVHGSIGQSRTQDYLQAAITGTSARQGRGGYGLQTVLKIAKDSKGSMWLRSNDSAIYKSASDSEISVNLTSVPGTQLSIELFGSSR